MSLGVQPAYFPFLPPLHFPVKGIGVAPRAFVGRGDGYRDETVIIGERLARPAVSRIVRDRNNACSGSGRQQRSTQFIAPHFSWRDSGSLGKQEGPAALVETLPPNPHYLLEGVAAFGPVYGNHAQQGKAPSEEERKSVVEGKSVSVRVYPGGRRIIQKKKK